ncbi:MAG: phage tail tape measure protein [Phycisphaerales bacterium]
MAKIGDMEVVLGLNGKALRDGLAQAKRDLDRFVGIVGVASRYIAVALGGNAIYQALKRTADSIDKINDTANRLKVPVEYMAGLKHAADLSGVSFEELTSAVDKFRNNLGKLAATDEGKARKFVQLLGVQVEDAAGNLRDIPTLIDEVGKAIAGLPKADQGAFTAAIFGSTKIDQIGVQSLRAYVREARSLGVAFTPAQAEAADRYGDALTRLGAAWEGLKAKIVGATGGGLAEALNLVAFGGARLADAISTMLGGGGPVWKALERAKVIVVDLVMDLNNLIYQTAFAGLRAVVETLLDNLLAMLKAGLKETLSALAAWTAATFPGQSAVLSAAAAMLDVRFGVNAPGADAFLKDVAQDIQPIIDATNRMMGRLAANGGQLAVVGADLQAAWVGAWTDIARSMAAAEGAAGGLNDALRRLKPDVPDEWAKRWRDLGTEMESAVKKFADSAADTFADLVVDGKASFQDLAKSWAKTLVSMLTKALILQPIFDALGAGIGGLFGGRGSAARVPDQLAPIGSAYAALGKVVSGGVVQAFASGGIVGGPTLFPLRRGMGLMGEAGPEAIMPLGRIGGKLGVLAAGGGVTVNVIDQRGRGEPVEVRRSRGPDGRTQVSLLIRDAVRGMIGDGSFDGAMGTAYGLRRQGATR